MRHMVKKIVMVMMVFSLLAGVLSMPIRSEAKSTYWLVGVSRPAGGNLRMYYKGNTIILKGKAKKSASRDTVYDAAEKKCSCTLKAAGNCKVTFVEADNNRTVTYKKWAKDMGYKKGAEVSFIEATFKVSGGKITRIYFSA